MTGSELFIDYYNKIDQYLNSKGSFKDYESFSAKLNNVAKRESVVKQFEDELLSFSSLRNAIVHSPRIGGRVIAEPHDVVVKRIQEIYNILSNPKKVYPTFSFKVVGASPDEYVNGILKQISEHSYSQFPVIENGHVIELINTNSIARWLSSNLDVNGSILNYDIRVRDLLPHVEFRRNFKFISKNTDVYKAYNLFISHITEYKRNLDVLFITENGDESEKILGWVTIEDIATHIK